MTHRSLLRVSACALALAAGPVLTGCSGVVKNLNSAQVNTPPTTVDNVFNLNGQNAALTLGSANNVQKYAFVNSNPQAINPAQVVSASVAIGVSPTVTVIAAPGQTLPATFTLTSLSISPELDSLNAAGAVTGTANLNTLTAAGTPITLTQSGTPGQYTASSPIVFQPAAPTTGTDLTNLINVLNTGQGNNQVLLTLNAASPTLPAGSVLSFAVTSNQLVVSAGS